VARLTTYLYLKSLKIQRSGFDFKSNLTSVIGELANRNIQQDMFPSIMPCPMTLAPTYEAVRRENHAEKTFIRKKINRHNPGGHERYKDSITIEKV
jgi:hypothetical protein